MIRREILYLVPDLYGPPGGIARHGRIVCRALLDAGFRLTVLALHDEPSQRVLPEGIDYVPCRSRRRLFALRTVAALRNRPDLVLLEHPHFATLGSLVARTARAPLIVFAHGTDIWEPLAPLRRAALRRAERVICVSRFSADKAISMNGLDPKRTYVLYNCLEPGIVPQFQPERDPATVSLLTVSRIRLSERYKGHEAVIRSVARLRREFPSLRYHVVGDGDGRPELERLVEQHGVEDIVLFHGVVSDEELRQEYSEASIFTMPSWGEGFGLAFIEAMAHGKPAIAGNRDASVEVVRDGETGLVVDPTDDVAVTDAIRRLAADPSLRQRMGARAAEVAARNFDFDTFQRGLLGHVQNFLGPAVQDTSPREVGYPTQR